MSQMDSEKERVEQIARESKYAAGVNADTVRYSATVFARHWQGRRCLEMGPAEGLMTGTLYAAFPHLTVVEGAEVFCESLRQRFPNATVVHSLFEDFEPAEPFDTIVLGHVLEHVDDPVALLARARSWLTPGGVICAAVPNARSLHRQAAVIMGLLPREDSLNDADRYHGHRRVYNPESFRGDFLEAGLTIRHFGGYWLKPVSNGQIEQTWTPEMLAAFMALGERYPDIAGEIVVIAGR